MTRGSLFLLFLRRNDYFVSIITKRFSCTDDHEFLPSLHFNILKNVLPILYGFFFFKPRLSVDFGSVIIDWRFVPTNTRQINFFSVYFHGFFNEFKKTKSIGILIWHDHLRNIATLHCYRVRLSIGPSDKLEILLANCRHKHPLGGYIDPISRFFIS